MKLIAELTDQTGLEKGRDSSAGQRLAASAIMKSQDGLYAVMYTERLHFYSFPECGIEEGANPASALKRMLSREAGCLCKISKELGYVKENRAGEAYPRESYYYQAIADDPLFPAKRTGSEGQNGSVLQWHSLRETIRLISGSACNADQRGFSQARDIAALREYLLSEASVFDLQPSQFYLSREKIEKIRSWFHPEDLSEFQPVPVKLLNGRLILTDGHTRTWVASQAGLTKIPLVWDEDALDWELYQRCVDACQERNIYSVRDLSSRILSPEEYQEKWLHWCKNLRNSP